VEGKAALEHNLNDKRPQTLAAVATSEDAIGVDLT
jgi:hypothetical protein